MAVASSSSSNSNPRAGGASSATFCYHHRAVGLPRALLLRTGFHTSLLGGILGLHAQRQSAEYTQNTDPLPPNHAVSENNDRNQDAVHQATPRTTNSERVVKHELRAWARKGASGWNKKERARAGILWIIYIHNIQNDRAFPSVSCPVDETDSIHTPKNNSTTAYDTTAKKTKQERIYIRIYKTHAKTNQIKKNKNMRTPMLVFSRGVSGCCARCSLRRRWRHACRPANALSPPHHSAGSLPILFLWLTPPLPRRPSRIAPALSPQGPVCPRASD